MNAYFVHNYRTGLAIHATGNVLTLLAVDAFTLGDYTVRKRLHILTTELMRQLLKEIGHMRRGLQTTRDMAEELLNAFHVYGETRDTIMSKVYATLRKRSAAVPQDQQGQPR